ncbi:MAG TPA: terminase large subunit, partial [Candidatus Limnocylindrales bacterium]|nr:terminase large subunit [Candidatus Limnocylindrales bacterium]
MPRGGFQKRVVTTTPGPWMAWKGSRHGKYIRFIEKYCRSPKGEGHGKPIKLAAWQKEGIEADFAADVDASMESFPRGNGKSTIEAAIGCAAGFLDDETGSPQVPIIATTVGQAIRSVYGPLVSMVKAEPELRDRALIFSGIATPRVEIPSNEGVIFPISNDIEGLQGLDPSVGIADEIGFQPMDAWASLLMAGGKRSRSLVLGKGTPGIERENALFTTRKLLAEGGELPRFNFREHAADLGCKVDDRDQWRKANPAIESGFLRMSALETDLRLMPDARFRIFRLGQWVDGYSSWLGEDGRNVWAALRRNVKPIAKAPTWVGVDIGIKRDSSAVCIVQYLDDGSLAAWVRLWVPTKEEPVDVTDIMEHLRKLAATYQVGGISFDPRFFDVPAKMLHDQGLPMIEIPQSVERMTGIIGDLYDRIQRG